MMKKEMTQTQLNPMFRINALSIVLFIIMLILPLSFFILLNQQQSTGFGFVEVLFSITFASVITLFLSWVKSFMTTRPYLGLIIGLIVLGSFEYGLFLKYRGSYTILFASVAAIIALAYLGLYFLKYRAVHIKPDGFDDN